MTLQQKRFAVGFGLVFVVRFATPVLAQTPGDAYRGAADAYRQAAAKSPARSACYLRWAKYYDDLTAMLTVPVPNLDPGCSGTGSGGGSIGTINLPSPGAGSSNPRAQSGWAGALDAGSKIAQALAERQQRQAAERQQRAAAERRQRDTNDGGADATGSGCGILTGQAPVDMIMQDFRRRTGACQQSEDDSSELDEGVPGTAYSSGPSGRAGQDQFDPFSRFERDPRVSNQRDKRLPPQQIGADLNPGAYYYPVTVDPSESTYQRGTGFGSPWDPQPEPVIDGSDIPSTIDFPAPKEYTPPTDENGIITDKNFNLFDINKHTGKHVR